MSNIQQAMFGAEQEHLTKDDHYTPKWIFDAMGLEFDIDVASPPGGVPWIPKKRYFTRADDGLSQTWEGRIWCNPPFSKPGPWADRMLEHNNGVLLCPIAKSSWTDRIWASQGAIVLLPNRMVFERPEASAGISYPTCLVAFGADNAYAIARVGRIR